MDQDDSTKNGSTPGQFSGQVDTKAIRTTDSYKKKKSSVRLFNPRVCLN